MKEKNKLGIRITAIFSVLIIMFFGIFMRIYKISSERYVAAAEKQSTRTIVISNSRGTIYDRNLNPLVNIKSEYKISVTPDPAALSAISQSIDKSQLALITERLQKGQPAVATAKDVIKTAGGLDIFKVPIRHSGAGIAPHIIGYMDGDGINGVSGVEYFFNTILNEYSGRATVTYNVDGVGRPRQGSFGESENTLGKSAGGVVLTIDSNIQQIVENVAGKHIKKGAAVVLEPSTGKIRAAASLPSYDPQNVSKYLYDPESPLINRAFSNYDLGSVFKLVTAAAAIENGVLADFEVECTGSFTVGNVTFNCHKSSGHGLIDMNLGLTHSCNPYFISLAQKVGAEPLYRLTSALGFDSAIFVAAGWKTSRAVMPTLEELASPAVLGNMSFGQGKLMATPIHIAQLVSAIVNGGSLMRPTLLEGYVDESGGFDAAKAEIAQRVFSKETCEILKQMMVNVVEDGTGKTARPKTGKAGGKTGTAQTGIKDADGNDVNQGWFSGFYPADNPRYVIVVVAEDIENSGSKPYLAFKEIAEALDKIE